MEQGENILNKVDAIMEQLARHYGVITELNKIRFTILEDDHLGEVISFCGYEEFIKLQNVIIRDSLIKELNDAIMPVVQRYINDQKDDIKKLINLEEVPDA